MSRLSITEAVKIIPVSESTLRRDLKSGKVSFDLDPKGRKQIDVSELQRVYKQLKTENGSQPPTDESKTSSDATNDTHHNPSLNRNDSHQNMSVNGNDGHQNSSIHENETSQKMSMAENDTFQDLSMHENNNSKIVELLEGQVRDLKERLEKADAEKDRLLELANNLQKQNQFLMLPSSRKKPSFWGYLRLKR